MHDSKFWKQKLIIKFIENVNDFCKSLYRSTNLNFKIANQRSFRVDLRLTTKWQQKSLFTAANVIVMIKLVRMTMNSTKISKDLSLRSLTKNRKPLTECWKKSCNFTSSKWKRLREMRKMLHIRCIKNSWILSEVILKVTKTSTQMPHKPQHPRASYKILT